MLYELQKGLFKQFKERRASEKSKPAHLALLLPEIVDQIISYLVIPYQFHESKKIKFYQNIYPCLLVNRVWHDTAVRYIWRHITFEDNKSEMHSLLKFTQSLSSHHSHLLASSSVYAQEYNAAAGLAGIGSRFLDNSNNSRKRIKKQKYHNLKPKSAHLDTNEDPMVIQSQSQIFDTSSLPHEPYNLRLRSTQPPPAQAHFEPNCNYSYHQAIHRNAIRSLTLRKIKDKNVNEILIKLSPYTFNLEKLDIYICDHFSDQALGGFLRHRHLTNISLAGCTRITDKAIVQVALSCPKLASLDLRACGLISDVSIKAIADNCPNLHHLNVGRVRDREKITSASIKLIAQKTKISVLGLAGCDITDDCLIAIAQCRGPALERISVNNCVRITNRSVQAIVEYCPNLTVFEMKECNLIDDWRSVTELVQRKVLLTLCNQQNIACTEWARKRGKIIEVKPPIK